MYLCMCIIDHKLFNNFKHEKRLHNCADSNSVHVFGKWKTSFQIHNLF